MPIFLRALEEGARNAGLAVDEVGLDALMEKGKLTLEILPFVSKALSDIARNNNAVEKAVSQNFAPALGRVTNTLKDLANSIFKGMKPAMVAVLNSFSAVGDEGKILAKTIGSFVGGAITGLTFPIAILVAGLTDLVTLFKELTGISDETSESFLTFGAKAAGIAAGLFGLYKIVKLLVGGIKTLTKGWGMFTSAAGKAGKAVDGVTSAAGRALSIFSKLFGVISSLMVVWDARAGGDLSATSLFGQNSITEWLDKPITEHFSNSAKQIQSKQSIDVNIGVDPATGNLNGYVTGKMDEYVNDMFQGTYNSMSPSN